MELDYPDKSGTALRSKLEHLEERGIPQAGLDVLIPVDMEHLWDIFWELNASRGSSGFGPSPISYLEIEAWTRITHKELTSWEISVLRQMDAAYLLTASEMQKRYYPTDTTQVKKPIGR